MVAEREVVQQEAEPRYREAERLRDLGINVDQVDQIARRRPTAAASQLYNGLLRVTLGFEGTDTHGLKAFVRAKLLPTVSACVVDRDVFASELVIRAYRAKLAVQEIPVRVIEKRTPSINLTRRVPSVLRNLAKLTWAIRVRG